MQPLLHLHCQEGSNKSLAMQKQGEARIWNKNCDSLFAGKEIQPSFHAEEWANKVSRYTTLTEHLVKSNPKRASEPPIIKQGEAERVLKLITPQVRQSHSTFERLCIDL